MPAPNRPGIIMKVDNTNDPKFPLLNRTNFMAKAFIAGSVATIEFSFDVSDAVLHDPPNNPGISDEDWDKNKKELVFWGYEPGSKEILAMTKDAKLVNLEILDKDQDDTEQQVFFDFIVDDGKIGGAGQ